MLRLHIENTLDEENKMKICKLSDIARFTTGKLNSNVATMKGRYPFFTCAPKPLTIDTYAYDTKAVILAGNNAEGNFHIQYYEGKFNAYQRTYIIETNDETIVDIRYLYYALKICLLHFKQISQGTATKFLTAKILNAFELPIPRIEEQQKIAFLLAEIDEKIKTNEIINNNLLEQVLAIYRHRFVDTTNELRQICRADEYFDISIGKTPPRKEPQWFSTNPKDVTWVSISDMGTCGLYISESSEQLTKEAVDRHNVKIVPDNTVLLSFKLTVGRIAITDGEMTTNEAIAHFKTNKKEINEYLYCYLKCFNYQTMGSTSSIATAVNSKIIKGMPFIVPTDEEITEFHSLAAPMFARIKANQAEIRNLTLLRDALLPKLMSGEINISDIDI